VMFSLRPETRNSYLALFRERRIGKRYEAIAPALPAVAFPCTRRTRLMEGDPFILTKETDGAPNSETHIDVLERRGEWWRYGLEPVTGRKHQLRVHLNAMGAPIRYDPFYPVLAPRNAPDDYQRPLKLLARSLSFVDPVSGEPRSFESRHQLDWS
jgi:tRNA pseudouridine32 synthase/23S rRNA pseudouridine746 synthase